jgi:CheY-like chemotaxis protein
MKTSRATCCGNICWRLAHDPEAAWEPGAAAGGAEPPDVICLDLMMPDLDGFEVLRALKSDPATCGIPVVVVTSKALTAEDRQTLLAFGTSIVAKDGVLRENALAAIENAMRGTEATA